MRKQLIVLTLAVLLALPFLLGQNVIVIRRAGAACTPATEITEDFTDLNDWTIIRPTSGNTWTVSSGVLIAPNQNAGWTHLVHNTSLTTKNQWACMQLVALGDNQERHGLYFLDDDTASSPGSPVRFGYVHDSSNVFNARCYLAANDGTFTYEADNTGSLSPSPAAGDYICMKWIENGANDAMEFWYFNSYVPTGYGGDASGTWDTEAASDGYNETVSMSEAQEPNCTNDSGTSLIVGIASYTDDGGEPQYDNFMAGIWCP